MPERPWAVFFYKKRCPRLPGLVLAVFVVLISLVSCEHDSLICEATNSCRDVSHTVLKLHKRDDALARQIALDHGMVVKGSPFLDSHYFVQHDASLSRRRKREVVDRLSSHPDVHSVIEDRPRTRSKRDYVPPSGAEDVNITRVKREQTAGYHAETKLPVPVLPFPDPLYESQWYLVGKAIGGYDMNVREAWKLGYAGRNVSVSILDDGIQLDHPDLAENYDPIASTDINDHDDDPTPQDNGHNKHGTRCAGVVAAVAGNSHCGVGIAYHAKIGGIRLLDGNVSDSVEAAALSHNFRHVDIYSASWGPEDDGKIFGGPGPLAREAFYRGAKYGRGGRGNIFVWASGNGGFHRDSCSADGYVTTIYTLAISSATALNLSPWYLEECPATMASTYSSDNFKSYVVSSDVPSGCTKSHTGTSVSAPLATGIIALALEANPLLTWRDMQHIVLRTANPTPLLNNPGWSINGVGRQVSNKFGYGLMDAGALVKLARVWKTVPEQHRCTYEYDESHNPSPIKNGFALNFTRTVTTSCPSGTTISYLEHVQVVTTIHYARRGDLRLTLYSPAGTRSVLLPLRPHDDNKVGLYNWPFLSVQTWGESPFGTWTLQVESFSADRNITGAFHSWDLCLYGTQEPAQPTDSKHEWHHTV